MEENSKNSAWFRVILLIAAIPLCIYMKADFFNAVIYMFTLFLMGFRSKGSGAVKNIGMLMSLISPALLFMSAPVWIMPDMYSPHVGVFVEKLGDTSHSDIELIVNPQKYSGQMYVSSGVEDAGHIRKILIYGSDEEVTRIRGMIKAVEDKKDTLNSLFKNVPRDGRLHYINIPKSLIVTMV